jgi:hypothetical protein
MQVNIGWWIVPLLVTVLLLYKASPKDGKYKYTGGNFSHLDLTNLLRLIWLIPVGFVWVVYLLIEARL